MPAQERQRLRRRHLEHRRAEPPLQVALRHLGELDVEGAVLAAREKARGRQRVERAQRLGVGRQLRDGGGDRGFLPPPAANEPGHERGDEHEGDPERDPEGAADRHRRRAADVGELLRLRVLRQQRGDLQRHRPRGRLALGAVRQSVAHGDGRDLRFAQRVDGRLVAVRARLGRAARRRRRLAACAARRHRSRPRPGNVNVVPAGPIAFSSTVKVSPTVTSALLAVAVTDTGEGAGVAAPAGGGAARWRRGEHEQGEHEHPSASSPGS